MIPNADQEEALKRIFEWFHHSKERTFKLGGLAGTGKSSLIPFIPDYTLVSIENVMFVAPTNKASLVIQNRLNENNIKSNSRTLHRSFYAKQERHCDACPLTESLKFVCHGASGYNLCGCYLDFYAKTNHDSNIKLIICDESSMISREVYDDVLHNTDDKIKILFVGDHGQLEAIEENTEITKRLGKFELMKYPDFILKEIQRQAKDSAIIQLAHQVRSGHIIEFGKHGPGVEKVDLANEIEFDPSDPDLVGITYFAQVDPTNPYHKGRISVGDLNRMWRSNLGITSPHPVVGERLVCRDYIRRFGIPKGTMGVVRNISTRNYESYDVELVLDDGRLYEGFISSKQLNHNKAIWGLQHLDKWDFGYGLTCHTAQGSEFESVVVFEPSKSFINWLGRVSYSKWLYTAITRAKRQLLLVG